MKGTVCKPSNRAIGNTRLFSIGDVAEVMGTCPVTASKIIDETGRAIIIHRKKYVLESALMDYLREKEAVNV